MEDRNYYIDLLESGIVDFNPYWESPMGETLLRKDTEQAVNMLKSYFNILKEFEKVLKPTKEYDKYVEESKKFEGDYESYPTAVKETIQSIIKIISDGRDLWTPTEWKGRIYDHHIQSNGHLQFENDPWSEVHWCEKFLDSLTEIINSEKNTVNLSKYIDGKWYLFQGYENGSMSVRFTKINKTNKGKYTFDGDIINWATVDSHYDGDGIIINNDCENVSFGKLPYCDGEFKSDKDLEEFIESAEEVETDEEIKEQVHETMDSFLEDLLNIG